MSQLSELSARFDALKLEWMEARARSLPAVLFGQRFDWPGGSVAVQGCLSAEAALWRAGHMLFRSSLTRRQIRKALGRDQRERLLAIARAKIPFPPG